MKGRWRRCALEKRHFDQFPELGVGEFSHPPLEGEVPCSRLTGELQREFSRNEKAQGPQCPQRPFFQGVITNQMEWKSGPVLTLPGKEAAILNPGEAAAVLPPGPSLAHEVFWL